MLNVYPIAATAENWVHDAVYAKVKSALGALNNGDAAPDWAETGGEESLLAGLRRHFREKPVADLAPGDVIAFRWRPHLPAKHAGIMVADAGFVHAYQGGGAVCLSALVPQWRRRIAGVFAFPEF